MGSGQPIPSFMGNPFSVCICGCAYSVHGLCTCTQLHPTEGKQFVHYCAYSLKDACPTRVILQILFMPGCDADAADSVFQAHSCLCVNWKSTASDLSCPLNRLWANLASSSSSFPLHSYCMPSGTLLSRTGFNFHLFTASPRLCVPPTVTDAHNVWRPTHLDHNSPLHNSYAVLKSCESCECWVLTSYTNSFNIHTDVTTFCI